MTIISRDGLLEIIYRELPVFANVMVLDMDYAMPVKDSLLSDLYNELPAVAASLGWDYSWEEFQDCDDFALFARSIVGLKHQLAAKSQKVPQGVAFGVLCYCIGGDKSKGHAINFFISPEDGAPKISFYEPQTRQLVRLSAAEKLSVFSVIL